VFDTPVVVGRILWNFGNRWGTGPPAHMCTFMVFVSGGPSVVARDWSPVSGPLTKPGAYSPAVFARRWCGAGRPPRGAGAGLAPRPQVLPISVFFDTAVRAQTSSTCYMARGEAGAEQHLGGSLIRCCRGIITGSGERQQWRLVAERRQTSGLHGLPSPRL
jgi:hypothetical protein